MAIYDYYVSKEFLRYEEGNEVSGNYRNRSKEMLGHRINFMFYKANDYNTGGIGFPYIVDAIMGGTGKITLDIAYTLQRLIPECDTQGVGRPIFCKDIININLLPVKVEKKENYWILMGSKRENEKTVLLQDERYLVEVENKKGTSRKEEGVYITLYKK